MMEFKQIVQNFKGEHLKADEVLPFSLLPLLVDVLVQAGLDRSQTNGKFYQELAAEIADKEDLRVQSYMIDALFVLNQKIPLPKQIVQEKPVEKEKPKVEAIVEDDIIRTDHLTDNIPHENDEGDPLYTPPEERINLRPEDFKPKQYDEVFCNRIGATKERRG